MISSGKALIRPAHGRPHYFRRTFALCALAALLVFLPFQILDGGFFHYAGDFNGQQITFYRYMNEFIKSGGGFSWATDLGSGAVNAYSFYLYGSPFFWLSLLFPAAWLPYLMCPLLALKFGVAGGGAYLYLKRYAKTPVMAMVGACLYAFSGFSVYSVFFNHFVDVVTLFPYMLWALDEAVYAGRRGLFALFAALNLLNNYFFFAGQILFLVIYFVCKVASGEYRLTARLFFRLALESLLAAGMGCVLAWPAVLSLAQNPRTVDLSSGWGFLTYSRVQQYLAILVSWLLPPDSPYITSIWSEGVIKWTNMTAYLPLCSLAGVITCWRARRGTSTRRILGTCAVFALVPVLNSAFYCLNSSYYARWYYMPVLIMALATMQALEDDRADLKGGTRTVFLLMLATLAFALVPVHDADTDSWTLGVLNNPGQYFAVLLLGLAGLAIYDRITTAWRSDRHFGARMLAGVLAFGCLYSVCHIAIGKFGQWDTDSDLVEQYNGALALREVLPEGDYRVDAYETHDNMGLWLNKSCLQYFGSTAAPSILAFYPEVDVKRDVRSQPDVDLYALRGLLSVKYTVMPADKMDAFEADAGAGWTRTGITAGGLVLYENENYIPMGFTYRYYVTEEQFEKVSKSLRGNLLTRAILLSEEQISRYGSLLEPLPDAELYRLDYNSYTADCADRRAAACDRFEMKNTGFSAHITLETGSLVFFSVPWDDGFSATVNGGEAETLRVDNGLMAVYCPSGENEIEFTFHTAGLALSSRISLVSCVLFAAYLLLCAGRRRRRAARHTAQVRAPWPEEEAARRAAQAGGPAAAAAQNAGGQPPADDGDTAAPETTPEGENRDQ